jgi:hypothetical protein
MNPFRALDDYVVPRCGRVVAGVLGAITGSAYGGHPRRRLLLGAAALSVALASAATVLTSAESEPARPAAVRPSAVRVGVTAGDIVEEYLGGSQSELRALAGSSTAEVHALAALDAYVEPSALPGLLRGVSAEIVFARVPLRDIPTEVVPVPLTGRSVDPGPALRAVATRKEATAKAAEWSANRLTGNGKSERELRTYYQDVARVNRAEARAYEQGCACVYGIVVRATPIRLAQLAARSGVRVVDPAPEVSDVGRTVFAPLEPEQVTVVAPEPGDGPELPTPG